MLHFKTSNVKNNVSFWFQYLQNKVLSLKLSSGITYCKRCFLQEHLHWCKWNLFWYCWCDKSFDRYASPSFSSRKYQPPFVIEFFCHFNQIASQLTENLHTSRERDYYSLQSRTRLKLRNISNDESDPNVAVVIHNNRLKYTKRQSDRLVSIN